MGLIYYHATTIFITTNKLLLTIKSKNRHTDVENKCMDTKWGEKEDGKNWQIGNDYILLWASQVVIVVKNPPVNVGDLRDMGLLLGWEDPLEKEMTAIPVFWPGKFHGQRSPAG